MWNGNRERLSNLWSLKPEKSIVAWTATRHGVYRRRYRDAARDPRWTGLHFVRQSTQSEADTFLDGVASSVPKEECRWISS